MVKRPQHLIERDKLLAKVPQGTSRVQVKDEFGRIRYRTFAELADSDEIQTNKKGDPVIMMTKPGRPIGDGVINLAPANDVVAEVIRQKQAAMEKDPILNVAKKDPESADLLHHAITALAEEAASIGFERQEAERQGLETSNISTRKINALKAMVDTWLKRKDQLSGKDVDLNSPSIRELFKYIFEMFREAMDSSGVVPEMTETVFAKVAKAIEDERWENEAKSRMRNAR